MGPLLPSTSARRLCFAHHGMLCFEANLERVFALAIEVETLARMYLQALQVTEPPVLPAEAMAEVLAKFAEYKS